MNMVTFVYYDKDTGHITGAALEDEVCYKWRLDKGDPVLAYAGNVDFRAVKVDIASMTLVPDTEQATSE